VGLAAPRLYLGFEIMLDQPLSPMSIGDKRFSLAGSRYYLVEFQYSVVPSHAQSVLVKMTQAGAVGFTDDGNVWLVYDCRSPGGEPMQMREIMTPKQAMELAKNIIEAAGKAHEKVKPLIVVPGGN